MEFLKKIVRGLLWLTDMSASIFAVLCVLFVMGMLVYNAMYITAVLLIVSIIAVYLLSKKYHKA